LGGRGVAQGLGSALQQAAAATPAGKGAGRGALVGPRSSAAPAAAQALSRPARACPSRPQTPDPAAEREAAHVAHYLRQPHERGARRPVRPRAGARGLQRAVGGGSGAGLGAVGAGGRKPAARARLLQGRGGQRAGRPPHRPGPRCPPCLPASPQLLDVRAQPPAVPRALWPRRAAGAGVQPSGVRVSVGGGTEWARGGGRSGGLGGGG
jgi:hypothetical protein